MRTRVVLWVYFVVFFCFVPVCVYGQPDAGRLLQEQRQVMPSLPDRLPSVGSGEERRPPMVDTGVKVLVRGFRFTGSYGGMVTEGELQELVRGWVGKELGFGELEGVVGEVTRYLRERRGYFLARAYLPKQDVTEGVVEIVIIVGRIDGKVRIDMKEPVRIRSWVLRGMVDRAVPEGGAVRMDRIEEVVLLMNDLPGLNVQASLEPGGEVGTTRLLLSVAEGGLFQGVISGDNYGDRYTGIWRGTGQFGFNDPFGFGDQFSISVSGSERMLQGRVGYGVPVGYSGLMVNISYSVLGYELGEEFRSLNAKGRSDTYSGGFSYPLLRSRLVSVWGGLGGEYLVLSDEANGVKTTDRRVLVGNVSLTGNLFDGFGGGGLSNFNVVGVVGNVDLSALEVHKRNDAMGPRTDGGFSRATYSLARLQRVTGLLAVFGSVRGQFSSGNLDSSQKFILGGPAGVRAYPVGEGSGAMGHAFTVEARMDVPFFPSWAVTQVVGFFDAGWVKLYKDVWSGAVNNISGRGDYWLSGAGVGLNVGKAGLYSMRVSYAHKVGVNDGRSVLGKDADGRSDDGRFWLQLLVWI